MKHSNFKAVDGYLITDVHIITESLQSANQSKVFSQHDEYPISSNDLPAVLMGPLHGISNQVSDLQSER